jgi:Flp pilus assembly protein TadD
VSLYWQGRVAEAEAAFRRAIALKRDYVRAHCDLGEMCAEQGRLDEAERIYREAIRLKPDSLTARAALPGVLLATGRYPEAETEARAALALNFEVARAHFDLWEALEAQRDWHGLAVAAGEFLAKRPDHPVARARLVRARNELARLSAPSSVRSRPAR